MNQLEFRNEIIKAFKDTDDIFFSQIEKYKNFVREYNEKVNLTRLDDDAKIYGDYFYESVIPYADVDFKSVHTLLDIGSGSGIPGVVLKLLFPHIRLTIIESNNKKITFLKALIDKLGVEADIIYKRAEIMASNEYEKFDLVTSRAVATLNILIEISLAYVKIGG
jgi:16S rRNA (guanine527-N7)-methyltransferase